MKIDQNKTVRRLFCIWWRVFEWEIYGDLKRLSDGSGWFSSIQFTGHRCVSLRTITPTSEKLALNILYIWKRLCQMSHTLMKPVIYSKWAWTWNYAYIYITKARPDPTQIWPSSLFSSNLVIFCCFGQNRQKHNKTNQTQSKFHAKRIHINYFYRRN